MSLCPVNDLLVYFVYMYKDGINLDLVRIDYSRSNYNQESYEILYILTMICSLQ